MADNSRLRINKEIRSTSVRVISSDGSQLGVMSVQDALTAASSERLDLVEISPNAKPPVCKIIDYGKFKYQQTKKEKESKKSLHQVKIKEVKFKPNTSGNDLDFKLKRAREFLSKGNKVKLTCTFRGREMMYMDKGRGLARNFCEKLKDIATVDALPKVMGRNLTSIISPIPQKKLGKSKDDEHKGDESSV